MLAFSARSSINRNRLRALSCMSSRLRWSEERKAVIFTPLKLQYTPCHEYFVKRLVFGLILLLVTVTVSAQDTILIKLEEPTDGGLSSGVGNIRGWAIAV